MSPAQEDQEKASTSILKERRFKLSRSVVLSVSQHTDLLTLPYLPERVIAVGQCLLYLLSIHR